MGLSLSEWFKKYERERGVGIAKEFARQLRDVLGEQAATRVTSSGRVVAMYPAQQGAPPRRVTGALQSGVKIVPTKKGARVEITRKGNRKIPAWLESGTSRMGPHPFWSVVMARMNLVSRR